MASQREGSRRVVGWRERVLLPDLCRAPIKAKIDTGAATAALHAHALQITEADGAEWAEFEIHPRQRSRTDAVSVRVPVHAYRRVRSSTGHTERRPVIRTRVTVGQITYRIEVTLTSRDSMGFRLLLGRGSIRRRFVVDPSRSYLNELPTVPEAESA